MAPLTRASLVAFLLPALLQAQSNNRRGAEPKVGPAKGTVIVVGGGSMGPEIYSKFIEAAGGPEALIIDVPNAGGADAYGQDAAGTRGWKAAGAKNVYVLFTKDRKIADSDSFVAVIKKKRLLDDRGRPYFDLQFYALTKDGRFAGATAYEGSQLAVCDSQGARLVDCAYMFKKSEQPKK